MNQRIKKLREALGMSQQQLADALDLKQGSYSNIETGRNQISRGVALLLEKKYNVNIKWLETGEGEMYLRTLAEPMFNPGGISSSAVSAPNDRAASESQMLRELEMLRELVRAQRKIIELQDRATPPLITDHKKTEIVKGAKEETNEEIEKRIAQGYPQEKNPKRVTKNK